MEGALQTVSDKKTLKAILEIQKSLDISRFAAVTEAARLLEQFRVVDPMKDIAARFAEQEASLQSAMASMRTPWLDMQEQMRSITGFVELQGIGAALKSSEVFDESLTAAL